MPRRSPAADAQVVLEANEAFYAAMRSGDLAAMDALLSRRRPVSCTHPNRPAIFGREAVLESWRLILSVYDLPDIRAVGAKPVVTGQSALVLCREDLGDMEMMASNAFVLEDGEWRMVNHQAAHIPSPRRRRS